MHWLSALPGSSLVRPDARDRFPGIAHSPINYTFYDLLLLFGFAHDSMLERVESTASLLSMNFIHRVHIFEWKCDSEHNYSVIEQFPFLLVDF
jgi:hypothetical protein